jgi:hypothetical protein
LATRLKCGGVFQQLGKIHGPLPGAKNDLAECFYNCCHTLPFGDFS